MKTCITRKQLQNLMKEDYVPNEKDLAILNARPRQVQSARHAPKNRIRNINKPVHVPHVATTRGTMSLEDKRALYSALGHVINIDVAYLRLNY